MKRILVVVFSLCVIPVNAIYADVAFERMCIFGDSLSDAGNVYEVTNTVTKRPYDLIPGAPYPIGGMTFSNGKTWIQQLAEAFEMEQSAAPAFRNRGTFCNYAFGSARAGGLKTFDLTDQVSFYLGDFGATPSNGTLFVIMIGGNDLRDAIEAFVVDPTGATSTAIIQVAVTAVADNVLALYGLNGAIQFLIPNAPNLALVPAITLQGPQAQFLAGLLTSSYNSALADALDQLEFLPGIQITRFDTAEFLTSIVTAPPQGITNATDTCITPGTRSKAICKSPDEYIFWDGIHPTKATHALVAETVEAALNP